MGLKIFQKLFAYLATLCLWSFCLIPNLAFADFENLESVSMHSGAQAIWGSVEVSVLSSDEASTVFQDLASRPEFVWDYPADECYAKAYLASYLLQRAGIKSVTLWSLAPAEGPLLRVETANDPKGCTTWVYHVAAGVVVKNPDGSLEGKVLDPALAEKPLGLWEWVALMTAHFQNSEMPIVWSSHPYTYRKEDLGQSESNKLLSEAVFREATIEKYKSLLLRDRRKVDSLQYQRAIARVRNLILAGAHPARQTPDPCPTRKTQRPFFEFVGLTGNIFQPIR